MENKKVMVSVDMITYKHEFYIQDAIESILKQETNFDFELIIADDCSPDKTPEIIETIINNHPNGYRIKYFRHKQNIGMQANGIFALNQCSGKYVAICEGDDYWINPLKLQKQVDFLENNSEYVIHSGDAIYKAQDLALNSKRIHGDFQDEVLDISNFLSGNRIITCTVMFRNIKIEIPYYFNKLIFGDWFLYIMLMKKTGLKVYKSIELFSVYRIHNGGVMSSLTSLNNYSQHISQIIAIYKFTNSKKFAPKDILVLGNYFVNKFKIEIQDGLYFEATKTFLRHFKYLKFSIPFRKYASILKHNF
jgi:glycosyltransferase involved in cell wall biosynthesis